MSKKKSPYKPEISQPAISKPVISKPVISQATVKKPQSQKKLFDAAPKEQSSKKTKKTESSKEEFVDMIQAKKSKLSLCDSAPSWHEIDCGLNMEGHCRNRACITFKDYAIAKLGFSNFSLLRNKIYCPKCRSVMKPDCPRFYWCCYRWKVMNGVQVVFDKPWEDTGTDPDNEVIYTMDEVNSSSSSESGSSSSSSVSLDVIFEMKKMGADKDWLFNPEPSVLELQSDLNETRILTIPDVYFTEKGKDEDKCMGEVRVTNLRFQFISREPGNTYSIGFSYITFIVWSIVEELPAMTVVGKVGAREFTYKWTCAKATPADQASIDCALEAFKDAHRKRST